MFRPMVPIARREWSLSVPGMAKGASTDLLQICRRFDVRAFARRLLVTPGES
jgi:hypothetical protein